MDELTQSQARALLQEWRTVVDSRDDRIRAAIRAGLPRGEIAVHMGFTRQGLNKITGRLDLNRRRRIEAGSDPEPGYPFGGQGQERPGGEDRNSAEPNPLAAGPAPSVPFQPARQYGGRV
jgi:hypothetical protein